MKIQFALLLATTTSIFAQPSQIVSRAPAEPPAAESKAGTGKALINPLIENLSSAKDAVVTTAAKVLTPATKEPAASTAEATPPAVAGPVLTAPPAPKMKPLAPTPVKAMAIDTESAINPLSGKSFSEEQLQRVLNANKLVTEIARQQVEQAKNLAELSKTSLDSRQVDLAKQRSDVINLIPKKESKPIQAADSLSSGEQIIMSKPSSIARPSPMSMASGTIQIGEQSFTPQGRYSGDTAKVVYVDTQPAKASQGGSGTGGIPSPVLPMPNQLSSQLPYSLPSSIR